MKIWCCANPETLPIDIISSSKDESINWQKLLNQVEKVEQKLV